MKRTILEIIATDEYFPGQIEFGPCYIKSIINRVWYNPLNYILPTFIAVVFGVVDKWRILG